MFPKKNFPGLLYLLRPSYIEKLFISISVDIESFQADFLVNSVIDRFLDKAKNNKSEKCPSYQSMFWLWEWSNKFEKT